MIMSLVRRIVPDVSNTHTRGTVASIQAFSEPVPLALTLVTR